MDILTQYGHPPKNHMQPLTDQELSIVFEYLTQHNQVDSIESIYADVYHEPSAAKPAAPAAKQPAQAHQPSSKPAGGQPAKQQNPNAGKPAAQSAPQQQPAQKEKGQQPSAAAAGKPASRIPPRRWWTPGAARR